MSSDVYIVFVKIAFSGDDNYHIHEVFHNELSAQNCIADIQENYNSLYYDAYYECYSVSD